MGRQICWRLECPIQKRETYLTFSRNETTVLKSVKEEGILGILEKCSLCDEAKVALCSNCYWAAKFEGFPVDLK